MSSVPQKANKLNLSLSPTEALSKIPAFCTPRQIALLHRAFELSTDVFLFFGTE